MKIVTGQIGTAGQMERVVQSIPSSFTIWKDATDVYGENNFGGNDIYGEANFDDKTVIQGAIDAIADLSYKWAKIFIRQGQYIDLNLVIGNDIVLEGEGGFCNRATDLLTRTGNLITTVGPNYNITLRNLSFSQWGSGDILHLIQTDQVFIDGCHLAGDPLINTGNGIYAEECWQWVIHSCDFLNLGDTTSQSTIKLRRPTVPRDTGTCANWFISDCTFGSNKTPAPNYIIDAYDTDFSISQLYLHHSYFENSPQVKNIIKIYAHDSRLDNLLLSGSTEEVLYTKLSEGSITNCEMTSCGGVTKAIIKVEGGFTQIHDNHFYSVQLSPELVYFNTTATYSNIMHHNICYYETVKPALYVDANAGANGTPLSDHNLIGNTTESFSDEEVRGERSAPTLWALGAKTQADAIPRFIVNAGGTLWWSDGATLWDVNLYRTAPDVLKSDDQIQAATFQAMTGDVAAGIANKGFACKTPDGSKWYRISVDNAGTVITTLL
jgi:hypothetical protein